MKIIALTGPIASGKTTLSKRIAKEFGFLIWCADESVISVMNMPEIQNQLKEAFPQAFLEDFNTQHSFCRPLLKKEALKSSENLKKLESILHGEVLRDMRKFIHKAKEENQKGVILEVPLLFELNLEKESDVIILMDISPYEQQKRLKERGDFTLKQLNVLTTRLLPLSEKKKKAHIYLEKGVSIEESLHIIKKYLNKEN